MELSTYKITKIIQEYNDGGKGIAKLAEEHSIPYKDMRTLLRHNGVKIVRGRKRGTGIGQKTELNGKKLDRRKAWALRMIESGRCTSCGGPNDSGSMYHCNKCLKDRTEAKKK